MASSSSSSAAIPSKKYHVFISFRGEDTRDNFTSHLHYALCRNNIETYIDYRLEKGEEVWPSLEKAIQDSVMFLIVFSENYASSTWCLKELKTILECSKVEGLHVIPVFYKIDPSEIRKQKGKSKTAFKNHEKSNPKQQVQKWRDALTHVANLSGWDSSSPTYRNEADLIREIVKGVLTKLDPLHQNIYSDGLVGIQEKVETVESIMDTSSPNVRFIGVWGMAGIGKTTIAKALFNKLCFSFDSFCFLANVKEEYEKFGIDHLKHKLLSSLLEDEKSYKGMPDGGSTYVGMRLRQKKVLVVLDDIDDLEQLKNLAGELNWFGPGSRIIITTRDKKLLGKNVSDTYEVKLLKSDEALELFKMNAFKDNFCDEEFKSLSLKIVDYANGLPLALTVLGCSLYGKDKIVWKSQLEKLRKMPHNDIQRILRISYEGLDRQEKDIFLFVACFFKRGKVKCIEDLLEASGISATVGLRSLHDKALLTIFPEGIHMHDLIQEMGMEVVREESLKDPKKRSRLWDAKDICQILKDNKGSEAIESITLDMSKAEEDLRLSPQVFSKMSNLLFLEIYNSSLSQKHVVHLPRGIRNLPNKLRYLGWDNYPLKSFPSTLFAENLVELCMENSGMRKLWLGVQNVVNLKKINLDNSKYLVELPDFSKAKNLEIVMLNNCASIRDIHPSIWSLNKMEALWLKCCVALTSLKSDTESRSLRHLGAAECSNLKEFSIIAENMKYLALEETALEEVPSCIGDMTKLESLNISNGKSMRRIHNNLDSLELVKCTRLRSLPSQLPQSLLSLVVYECPDLQSLPQLPPSLSFLYVSNCSSLETVQVTSTMCQLHQAVFENCMKLDEYSTKAILANMILICDKSPLEEHTSRSSMRYSGSKVPEWLKYKTQQPSIVVDLSSAPLSFHWSLLCCIVAPLPKSRMTVHIGYRFHICIADDELAMWETTTEWYFYTTKSNHVCLWFDDTVCQQINQIKERRATSDSKILLHMEFDCYVYDRENYTKENEELRKEIKEYGACPTYFLECQNFLNEMGLVSQASTSRAGDRFSSDKQDDQNESSSNSLSVVDSEEDTLVSGTCQPLQAIKMELIKRGFCNNRCLPCWCL